MFRCNNPTIGCRQDGTQDCELPINCPEFLEDLVECVGTLTNTVYAKMMSGVLGNSLSSKDLWTVILIKYLFKNLNTCVTVQDLVSWGQFLEDLCPDCKGSELPAPPPEITNTGNNPFDF